MRDPKDKSDNLLGSSESGPRPTLSGPLGEEKSAKDFPSWLLRHAVNGMPAERKEWGYAMLAELNHLNRGFDRWQFALSCCRVALFPPHKNDVSPKVFYAAGISLLALALLILTVLVLPEWSGRGLAWAYTIYGFVFLVIPVALFGYACLFASLVAFLLNPGLRARIRQFLPPWLRLAIRLGLELVFGFFNPVLYLTVLTSSPIMFRPNSSWGSQVLVIVAWSLLALYWLLRINGAAFVQQSDRVLKWVRSLLIACLCCLAVFGAKDAGVFITSEWGKKPDVGVLLLNLLRLSPLYLIPALLLWNHLQLLSRSSTISSQNSANQFYLLPIPIARGMLLVVVTLTLITSLLAAHRRSDSNVRNLIRSHAPMIRAAAVTHHVDPKLIASIVYVTHRDQLSPMRDTIERLITSAWGMSLQRRGPGNERWDEIGTDENPLLNLGLDISVGLAQIKPRTARTASVLASGQTPDSLPEPLYHEFRNAEPVGNSWPTEIAKKLATTSPLSMELRRQEVATKLLEPKTNLETCALILSLYQKQWEAANSEWAVHERPEILATLYQIGFARSKPHGSPRSNEFGHRVHEVYLAPWLSELL